MGGYLDPAIYRIEIHSTNTEVIEKIAIIDSAAILATGVPTDTFSQFHYSLQTWIKSLNSVPASKTFKLWNPQLKRYIVVNWELSKGDLKIKINGQSS